MVLVYVNILCKLNENKRKTRIKSRQKHRVEKKTSAVWRLPSGAVVLVFQSMLRIGGICNLFFFVNEYPLILDGQRISSDFSSSMNIVSESLCSNHCLFRLYHPCVAHGSEGKPTVEQLQQMVDDYGYRDAHDCSAYHVAEKMHPEINPRV